MSKFNQTQTIKERLEHHSDATKNYEGELAFKIDPYTDLYLKVVTTLFDEPKFYQTKDKANAELIKAIYKMLEINPEFVLQLAVAAREQFNLRSVPIALLGEFANSAVGTVPHARDYVTRVIQRADEITELIAYQLKRNAVLPRNKTILPYMIKNGVGNAFNKFDEYQFGKHNKNGLVTLKDALFLTHPKPINQKQQELFDKIANDELETPETWEVMRSTGRMTWHEVINNIFYKNGKVHNYMAILRNIRNIMTDNSVTQDDIMLYAKMLADKDAVLKSKQLPYRFLSAYLVTQDINSPYQNMILNALETAVQHSIANLPRLPGITVIASDFSGSMGDTIGEKTDKRQDNKYKLYRCDIGYMLAMMSNQFCDTINMIFGDTLASFDAPKNNILSSTVSVRKKAGNVVGYSTNGYLVPKYLLENNIKVDRIFLFTDCQMWDSNRDGKHFAVEFLRYQRKYPDVQLYTFDLSGYGTLMLPQGTRNVHLLGGWSERIFDFVNSNEQKDSIIRAIKLISP